jgi:hypothetical protein
VCFVRYLAVVECELWVVVVVREEKKYGEKRRGENFFLCGSECVQSILLETPNFISFFPQWKMKKRMEMFLDSMKSTYERWTPI